MWRIGIGVYAVNQAIYFLWWLVFHPGIGTRPGTMSGDPAPHARHGTADPRESGHSVLHDALIDVSLGLTGDLGPLVLAQTAALAAAIAWLCAAVVRLGAPAWAAVPAAVLLAILPPTGSFPVTRWQDVPYTVCLILVAAAVAGLLALRRAPGPRRSPDAAPAGPGATKPDAKVADDAGPIDRPPMVVLLPRPSEGVPIDGPPVRPGGVAPVAPGPAASPYALGSGRREGLTDGPWSGRGGFFTPPNAAYVAAGVRPLPGGGPRSAGVGASGGRWEPADATARGEDAPAGPREGSAIASDRAGDGGQEAAGDGASAGPRLWVLPNSGLAGRAVAEPATATGPRGTGPDEGAGPHRAEPADSAGSAGESGAETETGTEVATGAGTEIATEVARGTGTEAATGAGTGAGTEVAVAEGPGCPAGGLVICAGGPGETVPAAEAVPVRQARRGPGARITARTRAREARRRRRLLAGFSVALGGVVLFRGDGFLTAAALTLLLAVVWRGMRWRAVAAGTVAVALWAGLLLTGYRVGATPAAAHAYSAVPHDLAVAYARRPGVFRAEDVGLLRRVAPLEVWRGVGDSCSAVNRLILAKGYDRGAGDRLGGRLAGLWTRIAKRAPWTVLRAGLCRSAVAWAPWASAAAAPGTGIPHHPSLWRGALCAYASCAAVALLAVRRRRLALLALAAPVAAQQLSAPAVISAQDSWHMTGALIVGVLLLPLAAARRRG
ncbi:hypothetical protein [Bailinhaonella thermotolerans]|uniref:Uncharacterized protein n=1 Tax=Bailinhaonella thermotolerans TaxID=1070861 RepID=A0A3A4BPH5_9ACTN|nr:hypothetical protein [Bailinhaonella thermotolerans]RJL33046.1 hypothetical protein D5H75_09270 [Bailinhaonella thermotolerans]